MNRNLVIEFKEIIKSTVTPILKDSGFKKRSLNFNRKINEVVQVLSFQRSKWNNSESIEFTINLGIYLEKIFEISRGQINTSNFMKVGDCFLWGRSGHLIYNYDYWYKLDFNSSFSSIEEQIKWDFIDHIMPMFNYLNSISPLTEMVNKEITERPYYLIVNIDDIAIFELEYGNSSKGEEILRERYEQALIPKSTESKIVYPDGREEVSLSKPTVNEYDLKNLKRLADIYKIKLE